MSKQKETIRTAWDLSPLYASLTDPKMEKDLLAAEKAYAAFAKKYKTSDSYMTDATALTRALGDYRALLEIPASIPYVYLFMMRDLDAKNKKITAQVNLIHQRLSALQNVIIFFEVNLTRISKADQKKFLATASLKPYRYFLKKIFDASAYTLSEAEEKILSLKSLPSHSLWVNALKNMRERQTIIYKGKEISASEASSLVSTLPTQTERKQVSDEIMKKYESIADVAEAELNAIVTNKKINDQLRGYVEPYDQTILSYENDRATIIGMVKTVTDLFPVAHRFYKVKAKMLGLSKLNYADRNAVVGRTKKEFTFQESYRILDRVFSSLDPEFGSILRRFVANGQIDVFPKIGKSGGAYCSHYHSIPTYVLLNHTDDLRSLTTFAHEMGHAIHSEFSKSQSVFYEDYSICTAEVASTLFESFVFYDQFETLSDDEKIIALHNKISDDVQTIMRQVACFNFEVEIHNTIRAKGNMTKEELAACMNTHMKKYLGPMFTLDDRDGHFFVGWPHIRNFFYVYSYAFGQLASKALYKKYSEDPSYMEKIKTFLSLGGSMSPEDIFSSIGVDVRKSDFFKKGIESMRDDIVLLEKLVSKKGKKS